MQLFNISPAFLLTGGTAVASLFAGSSAIDRPTNRDLPTFQPQIGSDLNSAENPVVQPQDPALSGGGIDQSLKFGDILTGTLGSDLLIGRLGVDVLIGGPGDDVLLGGTEHFNSENRDRAFGGPGNDVFVWAPGDGSDSFQGGPGIDALVFGLVGEIENGQVVFKVTNDAQAGDVFIDNLTGLPQVDVTNSPGFCEVIDRTTADVAAPELDRLGLDHLVRFRLRSFADSFEAGLQSEDNGVRVTLHLDSVELVVCASRNGGEIEVIDLTSTPPRKIEGMPLSALRAMVR